MDRRGVPRLRAVARRRRERAREYVEAYLEGVDPRAEPVGRERTVSVRTEHAALSGRVDRIDDRPEGLVVVDYKTGRAPLTVDDARGSLALAIYAAGSRGGVPPSVHHR